MIQKEVVLSARMAYYVCTRYNHVHIVSSTGHFYEHPSNLGVSSDIAHPPMMSMVGEGTG